MVIFHYYAYFKNTYILNLFSVMESNYELDFYD
jgi:hypothetical protein